VIYHFKNAIRRIIATPSAGGYGSRLGGRDDEMSQLC
jgi:hypothetical protein